MSLVTYGAFAPLVLLVTGLAEVVDTLDPASAGPQLLVLATGGIVLRAPWWPRTGSRCVVSTA